MVLEYKSMTPKELEEVEVWWSPRDSPAVLRRWDALMSMDARERDGKDYRAFLNFAFETYGIRARANARCRNFKHSKRKWHYIQIYYNGNAINENHLNDVFEEIWEIAREFPPWYRVEFRELHARLGRFGVPGPIRSGMPIIEFSEEQIWANVRPSKTWGCDRSTLPAQWAGPSYFQDLMCVGKGNVPYMPREIREHIFIMQC